MAETNAEFPALALLKKNSRHVSTCAIKNNVDLFHSCVFDILFYSYAILLGELIIHSYAILLGSICLNLFYIQSYILLKRRVSQMQTYLKFCLSKLKKKQIL